MSRFWPVLLLLWSASPAGAIPESLKVRVQVHPRHASFYCGLDLHGHLRLKLQQLPSDGIVDLQIGSDYSPFSKHLPVAVEAPGYSRYLGNVTLQSLVDGQPGPVALFEAPVRLQPLSLRARLNESPGLAWLLGLGLLALPAVAGRMLYQRRLLAEQQARERRLQELGLQRQGWTGRVVDGLHILGVLGSGGMATVYEAEQDGQAYALKVLDASASDARQREHFYREVSICARLRHPRLVLLYRAVELDGVLGLLLEKVEGRSLRAEVTPGGAAPGSVAGWLRGIAEGLQYAHDQGVVHRDLKPDNLMLDARGEVKVMDFGIAQRQQSASDTGAMAGTLAYLAPELLQGGVASPLSDQYSLGVVLFELLTGQLPFACDSPVELLRQHLEGSAPSPKDRRPDLPPALAEVVQRMLDPRPEGRYPDVRTAARAFDQAYNERR